MGVGYVIHVVWCHSLYTSEVGQRTSELIAINSFKSDSTAVAILVAEEV